MFKNKAIAIYSFHKALLYTLIIKLNCIYICFRKNATASFKGKSNIQCENQLLKSKAIQYDKLLAEKYSC